MRTTLTLDPDVAAELEHLRRQEAGSLRRLVNDLLRLGLRARTQPSRDRSPRSFRTHAANLGSPLIPLDDVVDALAIAEGDAHR